MKDKAQNTVVQKAEPTYSQRFTLAVVKEFGATIGGKLELSPYKQALAQHLFIGIDKALKELDAKRIKDGKNDWTPIVWANVNMEKLSMDSVHRIELGLDALIPNHIHVVPYKNSKTGKYDLSLDIGYVGKDYYKRKMALTPPIDIIYHLVHATDKFAPKMKRAHDDIETYDFEITNPFDRGDVIGGFGYIMHADPTKNKLVIVPKSSFDKSRNAAKSDAFWKKHPEEMQKVCLVRRVTATLNIDPEKVNSSFLQVEMDDAEERAERQIEQHANREFIDVEPVEQAQGHEPEQTPEEDPDKDWESDLETSTHVTHGVAGPEF